MEQENRAGCILHGCGVLAALAGLCAASGAACVFALTPGWRVWALQVFFLLALAGAACGLLLYAAGSASRYFVISAGRSWAGTVQRAPGKKTPSICFLRSSAEPDRLLTLAPIPSNKKASRIGRRGRAERSFSFSSQKPARA